MPLQSSFKWSVSTIEASKLDPQPWVRISLLILLPTFFLVALLGNALPKAHHTSISGVADTWQRPVASKQHPCPNETNSAGSSQAVSHPRTVQVQVQCLNGNCVFFVVFVYYSQTVLLYLLQLNRWRKDFSYHLMPRRNKKEMGWNVSLSLGFRLSRDSNPRHVSQVELRQTGTFWTLYRLNYSAAAGVFQMEPGLMLLTLNIWMGTGVHNMVLPLDKSSDLNKKIEQEAGKVCAGEIWVKGCSV